MNIRLRGLTLTEERVSSSLIERHQRERRGSGRGCFTLKGRFLQSDNNNYYCRKTDSLINYCQQLKLQHDIGLRHNM